MKLLLVIIVLLTGPSCALKQTIIENPPRIEGRYDYVSMDLALLSNLVVIPGTPGEPKSDPYSRFRAKYIDPIIKKELFNYDKQVILRGTRLDLNIPQAKITGDFKLSNKKREPSIMIIWRYPKS